MVLRAFLGFALALLPGFGLLRVSVMLENYFVLFASMCLLVAGSLWLFRDPPGAAEPMSDPKAHGRSV